MAIKLYNTLTRKKDIFTPITPDQAGLYTCGPTVYDYAHIGNLRTYVFEDLLRRMLEYNGYAIKHVMNITDVGHLVSDADSGEDKMEKGARRTGKTAWEIAEFYAQAFKQDLARLNILEPTIWCKATDHIKEQIDTISLIEQKGFTYRTSDGIYFDTARQPGYGVLAGLSNIEGIQAGSRVDMGEKRSATDFALWKFSPEGSQRQMEWDSPWGKGFPGWHIECSAMSAKYLGTLFDIHCGGEDHIAVHHTNEIAQTEAAYGTHLANYWLHGFFLQLGDEKMAKSSGEFLRLQLLADQGYDPMAYRYFCFTGHYRSQLKFTWESLTAAQRALENLRTEIAKLRSSEGEKLGTDPTPEGEKMGSSEGGKISGWKDKFLSAINDDLNLPQALAVLWDTVKSSDLSPAQKLALIGDYDRVLGLNLLDSKKDSGLPAEVTELLQKRKEARAAKDWAGSDAIRGQILALGYVVEDGKGGQTVREKKFGE